jgi:hypothetical protein
VFAVENDMKYTLVKLLMGYTSQCKKQICGSRVVNEMESGYRVLSSPVIVSCVCAEL